tara:strand:+ start:334 stop:954 length:621 start_codon:yes stop_codon:yes gene_type:complete
MEPKKAKTKKKKNTTAPKTDPSIVDRVGSSYLAMDAAKMDNAQYIMAWENIVQSHGGPGCRYTLSNEKQRNIVTADIGRELIETFQRIKDKHQSIYLTEMLGGIGLFITTWVEDVFAGIIPHLDRMGDSGPEELSFVQATCGMLLTECVTAGLARAFVRSIMNSSRTKPTTDKEMHELCSEASALTQGITLLTAVHAQRGDFERGV